MDICLYYKNSALYFSPQLYCIVVRGRIIVFRLIRRIELKKLLMDYNKPSKQSIISFRKTKIGV